VVAVAGATRGGRCGVRRIASTTMAWARHRSDSIPRRIRRRISTRPYYCPATPNRPNAATQVATTATSEGAEVQNRGHMHAPQNCTKLFNCSRTRSLELSRRPYRRRAPWPRAHLLQRALRQCQSSTAMPPMLRAWHPTQRWRTMPPSYELLPFGSAMDQQGCHGSRLRRRG
jgi:hypothetical protein